MIPNLTLPAALRREEGREQAIAAVEAHLAEQQAWRDRVAPLAAKQAERRAKGLKAPASPFLDAVAGYDAPVRLNPPPTRRKKPAPGRVGSGIEKSVPNGDQG